MSQLHIEYLAPRTLRPYAGNARKHSKKQIKQIARSIERFGFNNPVLVSDEREIIAGHGRVEAAKSLGLDTIPTVCLSKMSDQDRRAYVLADNRLAELSGWSRDTLAIELQGLTEIGFDDIEIIGFPQAQIDLILDEAAEKTSPAPGPEDELPDCDNAAPVVTRAGDLWVLGSHRLLCGDARDPAVYARLLDGRKADAVLTDPPFNVAIEGNVSGLGRIKHGNFAMASGEMSEGEFIAFLTSFLAQTKAHSRDGAILFVFMDWRHLFELLSAGRNADLTLKNLVVWAKTNAGMGTFYRSRHELVLAFKNGDAPHVNTFELGQYGRNRTNVWDYAGVNTFTADRMDELAMHPTVKPVALLADAIRDVTRRNDLVLDPFGGSGSTLIAAEKTGRHAALMELDARYCDVIVRRWQKYAGKEARLVASNLSFEDVETERLSALSA